MTALPMISDWPVSLSIPRLLPKIDSGTELVGKDVLKRTENGVFTNDGRYFVAGQHADPALNWGIYEVVKNGEHYDVKQIVPGVVELNSPELHVTRPVSCQFLGLTTDGTYLYATARVNFELSLAHIDAGALVRILPSKDPVEVAIAPYDKYKDELHVFNGMAVGADGSIYMSNSYPNRFYPFSNGHDWAIYKVTIIDQDDFRIQMRPWLPRVNWFGINYPNGIQISDDKMYYASGNSLFQIALTSNGPGTPIPLYMALTPFNSLDDLVILPDHRVAVAEFNLGSWMISELAGFNSFGPNNIVIVDPHQRQNPEIIATLRYPVSSLAYRPGNALTNDNFVATSWAQGGIREFGLS